MNYKAQQNIW